MFVLKTKKQQEIVELIQNKKVFIFICEGCNEIDLDREEIIKFINSLPTKNIVEAKIVDYICNPEYVKKYFEIFDTTINLSNIILVFSCGVGVQTINKISKLPVYTGCDTFHITGYKGVTTVADENYDCNLCGSCYLNYTANICPLTSCPKELLNGPCGGEKNGKCEINKTKDCSWKKIFEKFKNYNKVGKIKNEILIRKFLTRL
ncbi:MAG: methylenetetrahydrofolate reductase C-terminal domain-containing protein [Endomicrobiia bacterium]